jgi:hypothetical protein
VHDLTLNWRLVALGLAPMVVLASLCLLPDALNLQHSLVRTFEPGTHSVAYFPVQIPYGTPPAPAQPLFSVWTTRALHLLFLIIAAGANLVMMCILKEVNRSGHPRDLGASAWAVFGDAYRLLPAFYWVAFLQLLAMAVGLVLLVVPAVLAFVWLYFAQYSLVIDGYRSWPALLHSRELMRARFFAVALRIAVFLAVWSGYNSWAGGIFVGISLLLGLLGAITGSLWTVVFIADLLWVAVAFLTSFFFVAAGYRLYEDLKATTMLPLSGERNGIEPTGPLRGDQALSAAPS